MRAAASLVLCLPIASAFIAECGVLNSCTTANQECVDPNSRTRDDWQCRCREPKQGASELGPATCHEPTDPPIVDECNQCPVTVTRIQAMRLSGTTYMRSPFRSLDDCAAECMRQDQCKRYNYAEDGTYMVGCVYGMGCCDLMGDSGGGSTDSKFTSGEKVLFSPCSMSGTVCSDVGQSCVDPTADASETYGDWECRCPADTTTYAVTAAVVTCPTLTPSTPSPPSSLFTPLPSLLVRPTTEPAPSAPVTSLPPTPTPETLVPSTNRPGTARPLTESPMPPVTSTTPFPPTSAPSTQAPTTQTPTQPTQLPSTPLPSTGVPQTEAPVQTQPPVDRATSLPRSEVPVQQTQSPSPSTPPTTVPSTGSHSTSSPVTPTPTTLGPTTFTPLTHTPLEATTSPVASSPAPVPATAVPTVTTSSPSTPVPSTSAPPTAGPAALIPATSLPSFAPRTSTPVTPFPPTGAPTTPFPFTKPPPSAFTALPATLVPHTDAPSSLPSEETPVPQTGAPQTAVPPVTTKTPNTQLPAGTSAPLAPTSATPMLSSPGPQTLRTQAPFAIVLPMPTSIPQSSLTTPLPVPTTGVPDTVIPERVPSDTLSPTAAASSPVPVSPAPATAAPLTTPPRTLSPKTSPSLFTTRVPVFATPVPVFATPVPHAVTLGPERGGATSAPVAPSNTAAPPAHASLGGATPGSSNNVTAAANGGFWREETQEQLETLGMLSAIAGMTSPGIGAGTAGKIALLRQMWCEVDDVDLRFDEPLDYEHHITGIAIGESQSRYLIGAAVMNCSLFLGFALVMRILAWRCGHRRGGAEEGMSAVKYPGILIVPLCFFLPGTSLAAGRLLFFPVTTGNAAVLGGFVIVACAVAPIIIYCRVLRLVHSRAYVAPDPRLGGKDDRPVQVLRGARSPYRVVTGWPRKMYYFAFGNGIWVSTGSTYFCDTRGIAFDAFRTGRTNIIVLELVMYVVIGVLAAWSPADMLQCHIRNMSISVLNLGFCGAIIVLRPYIAPFDSIASIILSSTQAVAILMMTIGIMTGATQGSDAFEVSAGLLYISAATVLVKGMWDLVTRIVDMYLDRRRGLREDARVKAWEQAADTYDMDLLVVNSDDLKTMHNSLSEQLGASILGADTPEATPPPSRTESKMFVEEVPLDKRDSSSDDGSDVDADENPLQSAETRDVEEDKDYGLSVLRVESSPVLTVNKSRRIVGGHDDSISSLGVHRKLNSKFGAQGGSSASLVDGKAADAAEGDQPKQLSQRRRTRGALRTTSTVMSSPFTSANDNTARADSPGSCESSPASITISPVMPSPPGFRQVPGNEAAFPAGLQVTKRQKRPAFTILRTASTLASPPAARSLSDGVEVDSMPNSSPPCRPLLASMKGLSEQTLKPVRAGTARSESLVASPMTGRGRARSTFSRQDVAKGKSSSPEVPNVNEGPSV